MCSFLLMAQPLFYSFNCNIANELSLNEGYEQSSGHVLMFGTVGSCQYMHTEVFAFVKEQGRVYQLNSCSSPVRDKFSL